MNSDSITCIKSSALVAFLGVLSGCGHVVALHDVQTLQAGAIPDYRRVDYQSSKVHASDIISLLVKSNNGKACELSIQTSCKTHEHLCQGLKLPYPQGEKISRDGVNPRITAFTLGMVRDVKVGSADCQPDQRIDFGELIGRQWAVEKQRIEKSWQSDSTTLNLTREVRLDERAFPGDHVTVVAENLSQGRHYSFQSSWERVDRWGELSIPQLTVPARKLGAGDAAPHQFFGQLIMQQEAHFRAKVIVWKPGENFEQQPTISHIERCLALRWDEETEMDDVPLDLVNEVKSCLSLGIHSYGANLAENQFVRFRLDLYQEWSIVLTDGRRFERPLVPGESLADAVRRAVRELTGQDSLRPTYVVVDPRPELRERPFTSILDQRRSLLDNVLLISGDVVHLSNFAPVHME